MCNLEFLWSLVIRHIPELKKDIQKIIAEYEADYNIGDGPERQTAS